MSNFRKKNLFFFISIFIFIFFIITSEFSYGENSLICSICHQPVIGKYWTSEGKIYCNNCYLKYGPRCKICNNLLSGKYILIPYTGNIFCENCYNSYPHCSSCDNPVGSKGINIDTLRWLCPYCYPRCIFTYEKLAPVYTEALSQLKSLGLFINKPIANLSIMYKSELDKYLGSTGLGEEGFCETWSSSDIGVYSHRIYVLKGLSYEQALTVLCHELAHAWTFENSSISSPFWCEGFADWVAYKVIVKKGFLKQAERMQNNPDPIYGDGLRYMLKLEASYGASGVIEYIRNIKK